MISKRLVILIASVVWIQISYGQKILNGNFEDVNTSTTQYNLSNELWSSYVNNCYAYSTGVELDIQGTDSNWGKAPEGNWWVSLASPSGRPDGFTMKLSSPLIKGHSYELNWLERADNCYGNDLDALLIGVSDDSMSFGTQISETHPTKDPKYQKQTLKFVSPVTGFYISVQNKGAGNGWNFVDDFELKQSDADILISYSPVGSSYIVSFSKGIDEVIITDADGKQLSDEKYSGEKAIQVDGSKFPGTGNIIEVRYGTKSASTVLEVN